MKHVATGATVVVGVTCVATGDWLYLVYAVAVLFALHGWTPWWTLPVPPRMVAGARTSADSSAPDNHSARRWLTIFLACTAAALLVAGEALKRLIVRGEASAWFLVAFVAALLGALAALFIHRGAPDDTP